MNEYKSSLCESYRDFAFIFDKDLGVYVVSLEPVDVNTVDTVFINVTDENKKDSIDDVINYVDDYYISNEEVVEDLKEDVEESLENEDSLKTLYGDLFIVELVRADDGEKEFVEFNDINSAQEYIDKIKIDNDEFFSKALLLDENNDVLDSWTYIERAETTDIKEETSGEVIEEDVFIEEPVEDTIAELPVVVELPVDTVEETVPEMPLPDNMELVAVPDDVPVEENTVVSNCEWANNIICAYADTVIFANNMKMFHWFAKGALFDTTHSIAEEYYNKANEQTDFLAELLIELGCNPINPQHVQPVNVSVIEEKDLMQDYTACLMMNINEIVISLMNARATDNLAYDIVSEFDSIIRYWNKENNYKNKRRQLV